MRNINRKSSPKVTNGNVRKKNNWQQSPNYYFAPQPRMVQIDRKRPGDGYKHILNKSDIYKFLELLPDWNNLAVGLNAIVLAPGEGDCDGYHAPGVVHICAWESGFWREIEPGYFNDHRDIFMRLGVNYETLENGDVLCKFEEPAIRAYQLLHIFLHELGHHHDRMTTRPQFQAARGEPYAEEYALRYEAQIWDAYQKTFPI